MLEHENERQRLRAKLLRGPITPPKFRKPKQLPPIYKPMVSALDSVAEYINQRLIKAGLLTPTKKSWNEKDGWSQTYEGDMQAIQQWMQSNTPTQQEVMQHFGADPKQPKPATAKVVPITGEQKDE